MGGDTDGEGSEGGAGPGRSESGRGLLWGPGPVAEGWERLSGDGGSGYGSQGSEEGLLRGRGKGSSGRGRAGPGGEGAREKEAPRRRLYGGGSEDEGDGVAAADGLPAKRSNQVGTLTVM